MPMTPSLYTPASQGFGRGGAAPAVAPGGVSSNHVQLYGSLGHKLGARSGSETAPLRWLWAVSAARMWLDVSWPCFILFLFFIFFDARFEPPFFLFETQTLTSNFWV
jgi:hypothetical protein